MAIPLDKVIVEFPVARTYGMNGGLGMLIRTVKEYLTSKKRVNVSSNSGELIYWDNKGAMCCSKFRFNFATERVSFGFRRYRFKEIENASATGSFVELLISGKRLIRVAVDSDLHAIRIVSIFQAAERGIVYKQPGK